METQYKLLVRPREQSYNGRNVNFPVDKFPVDKHIYIVTPNNTGRGIFTVMSKYEMQKRTNFPSLNFYFLLESW